MNEPHRASAPSRERSSAAGGALQVFYDGGCPVCAREIRHYRRQPGAERCEWVDVDGHPDIALAPGLSREAALARLHVRLPDGTVLSGAAAFAALWRTLPAFRWLGRLLEFPPLLAVAEIGYRCFLIVRKLWR